MEFQTLNHFGKALSKLQRCGRRGVLGDILCLPGKLNEAS